MPVAIPALPTQLEAQPKCLLQPLSAVMLQKDRRDALGSVASRGAESSPPEITHEKRRLVQRCPNND